MADGDGSTLRLALGMRGGVSLAVWIGGAAAELDALRSAPDDDEAAFHRGLLRLGGHTAVQIDVMSGASAGGLNAVLAASAMIGGRPVAEMRDTWMRVADLRALLESTDGNDRDRRSLLGGDYFGDRVLAEVERLLQPPDPPHRPALDHRLEVFLSATVHHGVHVQIEDDDYSPDAARRSGGLFHFRHLAGTTSTSDLVGSAPGHGGAAAATADVVGRRLARAARTTASFPTAFEPLPFAPDEMPGVLLLPARPPGPVWLLDGGIVDNIPVARAIEGVPDVPAIDSTDRWLIYLQPSPDALAPDDGPSADPPGGPTLLRVATGLFGAFMSETILDDVEVLRRHNLAAADAATSWQAAIAPLGAALAGEGRPGVASAALDATRVHALLLDPLHELQWRPIGMAIDPSPLGAATSSQLTELRIALASVVEAHGATVRPFAPIVRTAALLTQWARAVQRSAPRTARATGAIKQHCYHVMQLAQLLGTHVDLAALRAGAGGVVPPAPGPVVAAMAKAAADLDSDDDVLVLIDRLPLQPLELAEGATTDAVLAALYAGVLAPTVRAAGTPARSAGALWAKLGDAARRLAALEAPRAPRIGEIDVRPVRAAIAAADGVDGAVRVMRVVDDLTTGIHQGAATALRSHLQYVRIAGSNASPLCIPEAQMPYAGPRFGASDLVADGGVVAAGHKLAGASLGNFSAFISERWRANDWMWGRLDAAKSIVDVTTTKGRLVGGHDEMLAAVEAIVTRPFVLPPGTPPAWVAELDAAAADVWSRTASTIAEELRTEHDESEATRLRSTKRVLVLRRHWELLAAELPGVLSSSLRPDPGGQQPAPLPPTMAGAVARYESSPRSFGDVWGMRWAAALGVRTAFELWSATRPRRRLWRWLRTPLKPLPMSVVGTVLARNRGLFALALAFNVILVPRLRGLVAFLVLILGAGTAVLLARRYRRRGWQAERYGALYLAGTVAAFVLGVAVAQSVRLRNWIFGLPHAAALTHFDRHLVNPYVWMATAAAVVATWLLWCWARDTWRASAAVLVGAIIACWSMFSRLQPAADAGKWVRLALAFRPMLWAFVVTVVVTTSLAHLAFRNAWPIAEHRRD